MLERKIHQPYNEAMIMEAINTTTALLANLRSA